LGFAPSALHPTYQVQVSYKDSLSIAGWLEDRRDATQLPEAKKGPASG